MKNSMSLLNMTLTHMSDNRQYINELRESIIEINKRLTDLRTSFDDRTRQTDLFFKLHTSLDSVVQLKEECHSLRQII